VSVPEVGAVVVGAGIAGLAAAVELQREIPEVLVIDAADRPGGVMRTDHAAGYVIERGPNTLQVKAPMLGFLRRIGLEDALLRAEPASRLRFIYHQGSLFPVPMSPPAFARTPLLSAKGKLRLLAEPLIRRGDPGGETVAEFMGRRLGAEAVANLVGPFLTGVYAGDEGELGAEAVFPALVDLERRYGSVAVGLVAQLFSRGRPRGKRGSFSAAEGLGPFARRLTELLREPPALNSPVVEIGRDGAGWRIEVAGPGSGSLRSSRVVVAAPSREASKMLRGVDGEISAALAEIDYAPIVGVSLGVDPGQVGSAIEGFGFLVPVDAGISLLGCLFMSQLFPGRAPEGRELLQCLLGGRRWPEAVDLPDDVVVDRARSDLDRILGLSAEPQTLLVTRWPRAIPQPDRHHARLIAGIRARVGGFPGLVLTGSYLDGVSVSDTLASGVGAARSLLSGDVP
jgi:oxygen-dependent protoporphyrinogen oxidase